jgi:hypothetical protein
MEVFVLLLLVALVVGVVFWVLSRKKRTSSPPPSPSGPSPTSAAPRGGSSSPAPPPPPTSTSPTAVPSPPSPTGGGAGFTVHPKWKFVAKESVDGNWGVGLDGVLYAGGVPTKEGNFLSVVPSDEFRCRAAAGYGTIALRGGSWDGFCRAKLKEAGVGHVSGTFDGVVLVENATVVLEAPFEAAGLVVRRNGTCFMLPSAGAEVRSEFILCESGGILQAGSAADPLYRVTTEVPLKIRLLAATHGYQHMGVPCSQYAAQILNPGANSSPPTLDQCYNCAAKLSSMCISNATTPKSLCVSFNGTVHFAGWIPEEVTYAIWRAVDEQQNAVTGDSLAQSLPDSEVGGFKASTAYPATFCEVVFFGTDRKSAVLNREVSWKAGMLVVVSSPSPAWVFEGAGIDNSSPAAVAAPKGGVLRNVGFYVHGEGTAPDHADMGGVEVLSVETATPSAGKTTLTFGEALVFPHTTGASTFTDCRGRKISVPTYAHIGLVTRSIVVEGDLTGKNSTTVPFDNPDEVPSGRFNASPLKFADYKWRNPFVPFHTVPQSPPDATLEDSAPPEEIHWAGPKGSTRCEQAVLNPDFLKPPTYLEWWGVVYGKSKTLTKPVYEEYRKYMQNVYTPDPGGAKCANPPPDPEPSSWYGQKDTVAKGLDCVLGGSVKIMYGASFCFDGVEVYRMGLPGNAGSLGQYSVHFHMAGWGKEYLLYTEKPRDLVVTNCSNWRSFSRWVVLHGTNFATVRNNVFVLSAGNGIFMEDGVEHSNSIEHNLCLLAVSTGKQKLIPDGFPLGGVIGNAGFDNMFAASIWITNQNNYVLRNVIACNPGASVGIWSISEAFHSKSGPANLCTGTKNLPGLVGSALYAVSNGQALTRELTLPDESAISRDHFLQVAGKWQVRLAYKDVSDNTDKILTPYRLLAENVGYNLGMFMMEMGDAAPISWFLNAAPQIRDLCDVSSFYQPVNGDSGGSLLMHAWAQQYPTCAGATDSGSMHCNRVLMQNLVFDLGGRNSQASGGTFWVQQGGLFLIGDCILGGDYTSAGGGSKIDSVGDFELFSFSMIMCGTVTNGPIAGGGIAGGNCGGIMLYGDCCVGRDVCFGAGDGKPMLSRATPFRGTTSCNGIQDANPPSFLLFAGYEEGAFPLGDHNSVENFLEKRCFGDAKTMQILGLDATNYNACPQESKPRAVLFDMGSGKDGGVVWITNEDTRKVSALAWDIPSPSSTCALAHSGLGFTPVGCENCKPTDFYLSASLPWQTDLGGALFRFLCRNAQVFPGYTDAREHIVYPNM